MTMQHGATQTEDVTVLFMTPQIRSIMVPRRRCMEQDLLAPLFAGLLLAPASAASPFQHEHAMGAGMVVPGVHEAGGVFHHPDGDAGVGVFQEELGEQRLAQVGYETLFPGYGLGVKDLEFDCGHLAAPRCFVLVRPSSSRVFGQPPAGSPCTLR